MKAFIFLAEGFEEIEAVGTIDILRRGEVEVTTVSVTNDRLVSGAHQIAVEADQLFADTDFSDGQMLILPGGMPGARHLNEHEGLKQLLKQYAGEGKKIAAICAAPLVLGGMHLLHGKRATVYPGYENTLHHATVVPEAVVKDGNIITGKGPGYVFDFALALVAELQGQAKANEVKKGMFP
ncbi:thiazole biosynthesis protein ThiJ [Bacteroidia bacterium]|nr:thiazole biosynthesis protein ThiJ [Bacteroidia bacterium]